MKKIRNTAKTVYKHLQPFERDEIAHLLSQNYTQKEIAERLKRSPSTISREIHRNGAQIRKTRFRANRAQLKADERKRKSHQKIRLKNKKIRDYVILKLSKNYTPEQIAGRIRIDMKGYSTNYESIYLFIYNERPDLIKHLVRGKRKRQKRSIKSGKRMVKIPNRVMIDKRPEYINNRKTYGHWEADTVVSRQSKSSLVVIRERKMNLMCICKIPRKNKKYMKKAVIKMLRHFPKKFLKSITFDNGLENANHEAIAKALGVKTYFCNAYHSWEKGGVENGIGLIRRFFPKKTDFALISHQTIKTVEKMLNNRPRKKLGFLTLLEIHNNCA